MFRHALSLALPVSLIALLVACGSAEEVQPQARPAMVVHPLLSAELMDTYPGEVRARLESELAFRIGGKVAKRLVDVGDRVKAGQPLAELDPQMNAEGLQERLARIMFVATVWGRLHERDNG